MAQFNFNAEAGTPVAVDLAIDIYNRSEGLGQRARSKSAFLNMIIDERFRQLVADHPEIALQVARYKGIEYDPADVEPLRKKLQEWDLAEVAEALEVTDHLGGDHLAVDDLAGDPLKEETSRPRARNSSRRKR